MEAHNVCEWYPAENEESDKIAVTPTDEGKILAEDQTGLRNHENVKALLKKISMTGKSNLTKPEERAVGNVKRSVYTAYIRNWGPGFVVPVLLACTKLSENGFVVSTVTCVTVVPVFVAFFHAMGQCVHGVYDPQNLIAMYVHRQCRTGG